MSKKPVKDLSAVLAEVDKSEASDKVKAAAVKALLAAQKPPAVPPIDKFVAVAQCDFHEQMEVVRWLQKDPFYTVILALHHSDVYEPEDFEEGQKSRVRINGDGSQSEFFAGDAKPAHIHMIIKTASKIRASSLEKRFSGQLHFEACSDVQEYARYLTHSTFAARHKAQYNAEEIIMPLTPQTVGNGMLI